MRIKSIFSVLLLSITAVAFCNCSKNDSDDFEIVNPNAGPDPESGNASLYAKHDESGDNYTVSYKYNKDVVVLTPARQESYLVKVEADTILYFAENTPGDMLPPVGGLYSSTVTDKLPHGLGNKVVSRTKEGELYKVVTTLAHLDEIFDELVWDATIDMASLNPVFTDTLGNVIETTPVWYDAETDSCYAMQPEEAETRGTRLTVGSKNLIEFPFKLVEKKGMSFKGKTNLGAYIHSSGDVSLGTFTFDVEFIVNFEISCNTIDLNNDKYKAVWNDAWGLWKGTTPPLGQIVIGGVIVLRPYIELEGYFDISAQGTFSITFGKTLSARFGFWQNDKNKHYENTTPTEHNNIFRSFSLSGKIEPTLTAKAVLGCGLYTKNIAVTLDPYLKASVGAEFKTVAFQDKPDNPVSKKEAFFKINGGADGKMLVQWFGGLKWDPSFKVLNKDLFKKTWTLVPFPNNKYIGRVNDSYIRGASSRANIRAQQREDSPKYEAKFSLDSGLLTKFNEFYPALLVYEGDKLLSKEKLSCRYVEGQSDNVFDFGVYDIRLNQTYQFMPSVYYDGDYIPLDTIVYIDEVKAITGEAKDITATSATVECAFSNLPSWVEAGVKVWGDGYSCNNTTYKNQSVSGENTTRSYALTDLLEGKEYTYCAYLKDGDYYLEGEARTFKTITNEGCPDDHHPHMIDLGLPSGTKWACCDVGAKRPDDLGPLYAWGETKPKEEFNHVNYQFYNGTDIDGDGFYGVYKSIELWKARYYDDELHGYISSHFDTYEEAQFWAHGDDAYVTDCVHVFCEPWQISVPHSISGSTSYDAATNNLGNRWRMPSLDEASELLDNCTKKYCTDRKGKHHLKLVGPNGCFILISSENYWTSDDVYTSAEDYPGDGDICMDKWYRYVLSPDGYGYTFTAKESSYSPEDGGETDETSQEIYTGHLIRAVSK